MYKDMSGVRRSAGAGHPLVVIGGVELSLINDTEDVVIPGPQLIGVSTWYNTGSSTRMLMSG